MNPRGMPARIGKAQGLNLASAASCYTISFVLSSGADAAPMGHGTHLVSVASWARKK